MTVPDAAELRARIAVRRRDFVVDIALDLAPGETVAVMGRSGAGKSTLLGALAGLTPLDEGEISVDGRVLASNQVVARTDVPGAERCLTDGTAPLGLALHAAGTGFRRTVLHVGRRAWHPDPGRPPAAFKTYLIWHQDTPAVAISELFNPEFVPADRTTPGAAR